MSESVNLSKLLPQNLNEWAELNDSLRLETDSLSPSERKKVLGSVEALLKVFAELFPRLMEGVDTGKLAKTVDMSLTSDVHTLKDFVEHFFYSNYYTGQEDFHGSNLTIHPHKKWGLFRRSTYDVILGGLSDTFEKKFDLNFPNGVSFPLSFLLENEQGKLNTELRQQLLILLFFHEALHSVLEGKSKITTGILEAIIDHYLFQVTEQPQFEQMFTVETSLSQDKAEMIMSEVPSSALAQLPGQWVGNSVFKIRPSNDNQYDCLFKTLKFFKQISYPELGVRGEYTSKYAQLLEKYGEELTPYLLGKKSKLSFRQKWRAISEAWQVF